MAEGREQMAPDVRKLLDRVAARVGWPERSINMYILRRSFTAATRQLLDGGEPISTYTVAKWLGHGGTALVERVYSHLGEVRRRSNVPEYRLEQQPTTAVIAALQSRYAVVDGSTN